MLAPGVPAAIEGSVRMETRRAALTFGAVLACVAAAGRPARGLEPANVLVLYNEASSAGSEIASYYAQEHPGVQTLALQSVPTTEEVGWDVYLNTIRPQVLSALTSQIDCVVTTKGLPLRIYNPNDVDPDYYKQWNEYSSLESELTRVDTFDSRILMGNQRYSTGPPKGNPAVINPYYQASAPFSYDQYGIRLTARLDGFCVQDVTDGIHRARRAVADRPGYTFVLDDDPDAPGSDRMGDLSSDVLAARGIDHTYDNTDAFVSDISDPPGRVLGYVSHGRHGGAPEGYLVDGLQFEEAKGAVFHTYESFNAYSFTEGGNRDGQGLVAEWLQRGGTAGVGHVEEPGAAGSSITDESRMVEMLLDGYMWAEAAWGATFQLSYVNTVVGDPLMQWKAWTEGDEDLDGDVDLFDLCAVETAYGTEYGDSGYRFMSDMNANGCVNLWDVAFAESRFTGPLPAGGEMELNPEPATLALLGIGGLTLLARRRRR
jgi:uncharacterized protein (TIGR03790 family)